MSVSRNASRRPQLRYFPSERVRVREQAPRTLLQNGPHSGHNPDATGVFQSGVPVYAGFASHLSESNPKAFRSSPTRTVGTVPPGALAAYVPDARRYDELLDDKGLVRSHWQPLIEHLTRDDPRAIARRGLE